MKLKTGLFLALTSLAYSGLATAGELFELYQQALNHDARYAVAKARQESAQQSVPLARAGLLPRLSVSGSYARNLLDNEVTNPLNGRKSSRDYRFNPESYTAVLTQPLYRQANLDTYWQAEWQVKQADASLDRSLDELKTRITQAYLQVLLSNARLELISQQIKTYTSLRQQAQRAYESGYGTVTEVAESQSRLDELVSEEVSARAVYSNRLTELRNIVGNASFSPRLERVPSFSPDLHAGKSLEDWISLAKDNAPILKEQFARIKTNEYELSKAKSGHLPTIDLRLQYGYEKDPSYTSINNTNRSTTALISVNFPIFEGGATLAQSRRAAAELVAAKETERGLVDELVASVEKEFGNVTSQSARINALTRSVQTNELLVKATLQSVKAGVRSNIDVLNAENQLFDSRLKLTTARVDYLQSLVNLRSAVGAVQDDELLKIDEVLH
jgi:TolC family type I secretion outer membrane protein